MTIQAQFPDEQSGEGEFKRQADAFRDYVTSTGSSGYPAEAGRYHLYVSWACPWAHRTIIVRKLKQLEEVIGLTAVDPVRDERGWAFREGPGHGLDPINGFHFLSEAYKATDPHYIGRITVPALWDRVTKRIVTNSDDDLMRIFNGEFNRFTQSPIDLYPEGLRKEIDELNAFLYENVNDGVYRAGFATSQPVYERAVRRLFDALDNLDARLARQRYLFGKEFVESDWRLFVTLIRFDAVYHGHFKCNIRRIIDYPNIFRYLKDLYQTDGIEMIGTFGEDEVAAKAFASKLWYELQDDVLHEEILEHGIRLDGRRFDEIRPITCEVGVLPRTHGSALFTLGETQALVTVTLGTSADAQKLDWLEGESFKRFMLHYNFPPFSVGEVKFLRGPGRREIGHGALAERSLQPLTPSEKQWPYTIRIVSDILESNGSSSMATICGGSLSLMDAGVPMKSPR